MLNLVPFGSESLILRLSVFDSIFHRLPIPSSSLRNSSPRGTRSCWVGTRHPDKPLNSRCRSRRCRTDPWRCCRRCPRYPRRGYKSCCCRCTGLSYRPARRRCSPGRPRRRRGSPPGGPRGGSWPGAHSGQRHASGSAAVHLLQIWLLPDRRHHAPRYAQRPIPRATADFDVLVRPSAENAARVYAALTAFAACFQFRTVEIDEGELGGDEEPGADGQEQTGPEHD